MSINREDGDHATEALNKVVSMIETHELVVFTPEEARSIKELVVLWNQLKAVVAIGSVIGNTLKWAVGIAAVWIAFKAGLVDWLKSSAK